MPRSPICVADEVIWLTKIVHSYTLAHMLLFTHAFSDQIFGDPPICGRC